jgi:hypothetical protein
VSLAAAFCIGVVCYFVAGSLVGQPVRLHRWRRERRTVTAQQLWLAQAGAALTPLQFWAGSLLVGLIALIVAHW